MINSILIGIINFVYNLIDTLLLPIDTIINQYVPDLGSALQTFSNLLDYVLGFIGFCVDASGLDSIAILLIITYFTFSLTVPLAIWVIKVVIKWWHALVP